MSDLSELFAKDPLKLTQQDRTEIIAAFRENREKFLVAGKGTKTKAAPATPAGPQTKLSLDDLDL